MHLRKKTKLEARRQNWGNKLYTLPAGNRQIMKGVSNELTGSIKEELQQRNRKVYQ